MINLALYGFAGSAAILHLLFFCLESLLWTHPVVRQIFKTGEEEARATKFLAFNQGFYNLFLALGAAAGLCLLGHAHDAAGRALLILSCGSMLGAALVLVSGGRNYLRGALIQGLPPLLALLALWISVR